VVQQVLRSSLRRASFERLTSPGGLFVSAVMLVVALSVTGTIQDPDFWWHLRSGQLILASKALIATDPFTYTVASHHWTMHEWLTEVGFALMHQVGDLALIVLVLSVITWLGFLCILLRARLRRPRLFFLGLGIALATIAGSPIWGPRAQMLTFALSCLLLYIVDRHLQRGGRLVWVLVPLFVLWSNLHSGFIIGLGFLAVVILAEFLGGRLGLPDGADPSRVKTLVAVLAACSAASLLNPNGPGILLYALQTQSSPAQQSLIAEWQSPNFHLWEVKAFELLLLSSAALIAINRRIRARDAALAVVTTALALQSVRHIALFVAAVTPIWIEQAQLFAQRVRRRAARSRPLPPLRLRAATYAAVIGAIGALYVSDKLVPAMTTTEASATYAKEFPVCAVRWLSSFPRPLRIFNQYGEGGYLAYALSARGDKVFVFGDAALMGDQVLYQYAHVEGVQPDWDAIIRRANTDIVLFDTKTPLSDVMEHSSDWVRVYQDAHNVAFVPAQRYHSLTLPAEPASYRTGDSCAGSPAEPVASRAGGGAG
jgi:hypothetical protein